MAGRRAGGKARQKNRRGDREEGVRLLSFVSLLCVSPPYVPFFICIPFSQRVYPPLVCRSMHVASFSPSLPFPFPASAGFKLTGRKTGKEAWNSFSCIYLLHHVASVRFVFLNLMLHACIHACVCAFVCVRPFSIHDHAGEGVSVCSVWRREVAGASFSSPSLVIVSSTEKVIRGSPGTLSLFPSLSGEMPSYHARARTCDRSR
mmetsp:Transcript_31380/g.61993  ORF Transcript_31380/g.61993 Transcript_31380/m.61993 type:complete len:204 (-) Transcript_31380:148-759(-)